MKNIRKTNDSRGFALVVTLLLMVILTLTAVGLLSLSAISLRTTAQAEPMAVARANARLALLTAMGQLQKYAGPDQRITASADLTGATQNGKWTGVWSTTTTDDQAKPMVAGHDNGKFYSDLRNSDNSLRNGQWKEALRLAWLTSGDQPSPDSLAAPDPNSTDPESIELVGAGTLGTSVASGDERLVSVPYVKVSTNENTGGGYAYWVGDESQKARIDLGTPYDHVTPEPNSPDDGGLYRLAGAEGPDFTTVKGNSGAPYTSIKDLTGAERSKLISSSTVAIQTGSGNTPTGNFHDITSHSSGLLTDVVMGGLQKDLTAVLESNGDIPAISGVAGTGMDVDQGLFTPSNYANSGPSFAQIRNWYDLKDSLSGTTLKPVADVIPSTTTRSGISGAYYDLSSPLPDMTSKEQQLQPILTDCRVAFDFSLDTSVDPTRGGNGRAVRLHLYPRVTLWNPYNVTLRGQRYYVGSNMPQVNNLAVGGTKVVTIPGTDGKFYPGINGRTIYFTLEAVDLEPGEALVFSPDLSASSGTKLAGTSAKYDTASVTGNMLSASVPGGTNNFYFDSNKAVESSVNLRNRPDYNFEGGVNQAFNNAPAVFLKLPSSSNARVTESYLNSTSAKTVQYIDCSLNGAKSSWWWYLFGGAMDAVNGGEGFQSYTQNPNRYPPRLWAVQTRMHWLDETDEQNALGNTHSGAGGEFFYNNSVIGNFNVRANSIHRSPFSYYISWTKYAPGAYMIPWSMPRLNDSRMDSAYRNGKSRGSPFSAPNVLSAADGFAMFEVPRNGMPLFSLAALQHVQFGINSWHPTYAVGNSNAEPRSDREYSVNSSLFTAAERGRIWSTDMCRGAESPGVWRNIVQNLYRESLFYDMSYQINQRIWDRFFLSSMPYNGGSPAWDPERNPLPNSRLQLVRSSLSADEKSQLMGQNSFDTAAYFLTNRGAFNVNSTSVEAWTAVLSLLSHIERPTTDGSTVSNTFSRLLFPISNSSPDATQAAGTWDGARKLTPGEISNLAETMVEVVKERGPFLGLADFVNRRLERATTNDFEDPSMSGPLQAAIERAGINSGLQQSRDLTAYDHGGANTNHGSAEPDWEAFYPYKNFGAPGYLSQADILQTIAPGLTTRGDTFVIRCYGDARDAAGEVTARAWCEVVVQRGPDYIQSTSVSDPSEQDGNNPLEPALIGPDEGDNFIATQNGSLLPRNKAFGRRFTVQSFRWLSPSEI